MYVAARVRRRCGRAASEGVEEVVGDGLLVDEADERAHGDCKLHTSSNYSRYQSGAEDIEDDDE